MIHFVVVAGRPEAIERTIPRLDRAIDATRILEGTRVSGVGSGRTWAVAGVTSPDPTCSDRIATDGDGLVVFNGPALAARGAQETMAADALAALRTHGARGMADTFAGTYGIVGCSPGTGLRAFTDFSGMYTLYWTETTDLTIISNRSTTVAAVAGAQGWDLRAMAWQLGYANLIGDHVPARHVAKLPPGRELRVRWGTHRADIGRSPNWVWPEPDEPVRDENLSPAEWDEVTEALVAGYRAAGTFADPLLLQLTGGKDSRLGLALAIGAGLRDRIHTITNGRVESPEVEAAAAVAKAVGVSHERLGPPAGAADAPPPPPPYDSEEVWRKLHLHPFRFQSIVCPWDGFTDPLTGVGMAIKGFGGELYRQPPAMRLDRKVRPDKMAAKFARSVRGHDVLGVLDAEERNHQLRWLETWFRQSLHEVALDHITEKFYLDYHIGHWTGPLAQCVPTRVSLTPLLSSHAARINLRMSTRQRNAERLHFEVMWRTAPELVSVPFLEDRWGDAVVADSPVPLPRDPITTRVEATPQALTRWQWTFLEREQPRIDALFADAARGTDMGEICDMGALRRIVGDADAIDSTQKGRKVLSAASIAITLLGRDRPFVDRPSLDPPDAS